MSVDRRYAAVRRDKDEEGYQAFLAGSRRCPYAHRTAHRKRSVKGYVGLTLGDLRRWWYEGYDRAKYEHDVRTKTADGGYE